MSTQRWPEKGWALFHLLLVASVSQAEELVCRRRGNPENPQLFKDGDIFLGGIFSFHSTWKDRQDNYIHKPLPLQCTRLHFRGFQYAQAMLFAIEEINNRTDLLPGISLGYKIYDVCGSISRGVRVTLALANGNEELSAPSATPCTRPAQVQAIIGETSSSPSMAIATVIGPFHIPMISHFATCACLSDKTKYPSFLRTIPSDDYQSRALAQLVKNFGWTWVGAVRTNDDYGNNGMATFTETAQQLGICLEYSVSFFRTDPPDKIQKIIDIIKASTSKVIVTFLSPTDIDLLIEKFSHCNLTGYQWVGSEAWIFDPETAAMDKHHILDGAIGLSIPKAHVSGMREFILDVKLLNSSTNELFTEFWETLFSCKFKQSKSSAENQRECTGHEDLTGVQSSFTDMSLMPIFNNVYKGVYAVAHALHSILSCNKTCNMKVQLDPYTILQYIKRIHFKTKEGEEVYFNENGDPAAKYEIINWQPTENGIVDFVTVGFYDASLPADKQLNLQNKSLIWANNSQQGDSVCRLQGSAQPPELAQDGDLVIGGIFSFRTGQNYVINTFQAIPEARKCINFNFREFKFAHTMIFAINEINRNPSMLPNVKLGYKIYDNCGTMDILRAALALVSGLKGEVNDDNCTKTETVQAILGHSGSRPTIAFAQVVGRFHIPVISHFATCACLSNRKEYPTFFRTIPSDYYQSRALAKLVKHFGWTWIGALAVNNKYGLNGIATFIQAAQEYGVCVEYSEAFSSSDPPDSLQRIIEIIKHATSKVIMAFMSHREIKLLAKELYKQNITGLQWVGSDAWITDHSLTDSEGHSILVGSLGFTVNKAQIPGLEEHLRQLHPSQFPDSQFVRDFWEDVFDCTLNDTENTQRKLCSGNESLQNVESHFTDVSELRFTNNVYKSVYAVAHAIDNLMKCEEGKGPFSNDSCVDIKHIQPWQVLQYLNTVNFTTKEGEQVYFDSNGDSPARYELVNLQMTNKGTMEGVTVGIYDASLPESHQFIKNNIPIVWGNGLTKLSHFATCACLSNREEFPSFFRTIPSDLHQSRALAKLVKHFGWTWVGAISNKNDYGINGIATFIQAAQEEDVCVEYHVAFEQTGPLHELSKVVETVKYSTSKVIVAFMSHREVNVLATELYKQNITGLQWVGSDAWITDHSLTDSEGHSILVGSLGFTVSKAQIPGLEEHLRQLHPSQFPDSQFVRDFWEDVFDCTLNDTTNTQRKLCSGNESLQNVESYFTDVSELRFTNNVYKSVYAVAHALHSLVTCEEQRGPFLNGSCADTTNIQPWQVLHYLQNINFTTSQGERVMFDQNGDSPARYELINLQQVTSGNMHVSTVGIFDVTLPLERQFIMNGMKIVWGRGSHTISYNECHLRDEFHTGQDQKRQCSLSWCDFELHDLDWLCESVANTEAKRTCLQEWNDRELKFARTVIFTVAEINRDSKLLPGVSLGYRLYNGCGSENLIRAAVEAVTGDDSKGCSGQIQALLGHSSSGVSEDINIILSPLSIPQVSHLSTCACLSDKRLYPTFFRTVPSDRFQIIGLVQLMEYFDWRWVGIIYSASLYSEKGTAEFTKEAKKVDICVEYTLPYFKTSKAKLEAIVKKLRESSSKVVLLFMSLSYTKSFLSEIENYNITGKQWLGGESWITQADLASVERKSILQGAMGFALPEASIPDLGEFLLSLKPSDEPQSAIIKAFWEKFFDCSFSPSNTTTMCTGTEDLRTISSDYTDVTHFRAENNVYKAVYLVAYALHALLQCKNGSNPTTGKPCVNKNQVQPKLVLEHINHVNFTTQNGAKVFFDENGDSVAQYDLVNWQMKEDGSVEIANIVKTCTDIIKRYKAVLKKYNEGGSMKAAFEEVGVDRNMIARTAVIAELSLAAPEAFIAVGQWNEKSEKLAAFVDRFDLRAFRWTQVMIFAIEEINKDPALLPNISLGYRILNSCASPTNTLRAALTLASGPEELELTSPCPPAISALIAESGSSQSLAVAGTLGPFQVPIVSYFSTCACLSDRAKYPTFFRTIPSDYFQAKALAALVKRFGWQWIGAIQSDNDYGRNGILAFTEEVKKLGVCIAFVGTILRTYTMDKILDVVEMIKQSTVKVILAFIPEGDFYPLMKEIVKQNITGIQWIASEAWITASRPSTPEIYQAFGGALGFVVQKMAIPNLKQSLTGISPYADPSAAFVRDFWEIMAGCRPVLPGEHTDTEATNEICTGHETLMNSQDVFFNVTQLRVSYNVYKAVYAIAHALHQLVFCQPVAEKTVRPCLNISEIQPKEVTDHLQRVHFRNQFGDDVFFDANGDPPASYDIINWQLIDGEVQHVTLGHFASAANGSSVSVL
ncbi:hypothetical protein ABVT39_016945 [Epinephelus coioides]